uniref:Iron-sulfur cluster formation ABC transporter ATP-binding subunit n=1 Tax=Vertebrata lanosa TaxID=1261582 RepID=A0A0B5VUV9_9FLOR|nr:iron-sulfur cluster formation ABC transporter ATP-binding subunit [Vertebrata lanosa]AJH65978.1 iron-sulfur cluster formation ABC transporter ATP-binding subunit [Vertebrata lanosa]
MEKNQEILKIEELSVSVNDEPIIKGLNLCIKQGEIHAIMGKNGSGKSTLAKVISGHPMYEVTEGKIFFKNKDITYEEPDNRSHMGIFLGFQYPVEVPGVSNIDFLRLAYNSKRKQNNKQQIDPLAFFDLVNKELKNVNMDPVFLSRSLNEGFSGGEKKKNEILQMSLLQSELSILDEIDSGLDVDALKDISENINKFHSSSKAILFITHYQKLIEYIKPDYVHVMDKGIIKVSGNKDLATKIDQYGYEHVL